MRPHLPAVVLATALALATVVAAPAAARPARPAPVALARGVVSSPDSLAAEVGAEVLRRGGNAVDAAIAVHFALAVTFPHAGNLGGGGFLVVHTARGDEAIDFREVAPAAATRDLFLDATGAVIPRASLDTRRAAGVPGSVAGMWLAHRRHGSRPWAELIAPAVRLAEQGFALSPRMARRFAEERRNDFAAHFHGAAGERFVQPELAATLRRIAAQGRDGFYRGETARLLVAEMARGGGLITLADLAAYRPQVRAALVGSFQGLRIVTMPPPSSGGVALLEMLHMLEASGVVFPRPDDPAYVHRVAEIEKRVFADRTEFLGDPDFVRVPVDSLVSPAFAARRAADIATDRRTAPGAVHAADLTREHEETTHFSIADRHGNVVACTTTLNDTFGSAIVVTGAGFLLNDEMDDFVAKPGALNLYGVTGGDANAIAPGKRMLSSMTPTIVFRDGRPWLALGSPGGSTIFTTVFQVLVGRTVFGMPLAEAMRAPRFHHQWPPADPARDPLYVERERPLPESTLAALAALGYAITPREPLGDVHALELDGDRPLGVSDPRGTGWVAYE